MPASREQTREQWRRSVIVEIHSHDLKTGATSSTGHGPAFPAAENEHRRPHLLEHRRRELPKRVHPGIASVVFRRERWSLINSPAHKEMAQRPPRSPQRQAWHPRSIQTRRANLMARHMARWWPGTGRSGGHAAWWEAPRVLSLAEVYRLPWEVERQFAQGNLLKSLVEEAVFFLQSRPPLYAML
jgi:hypothetical protein